MFDVGLGRTTYKPFSFEKYFDDVFDLRRGKTATYEVNVVDDNLVLSVDLPGAKAADLKLEAEGHNVRISGKQKGVDFKYDYSLSKIYDPTTAAAKLEDGVLTLTFRKYEQIKQKVFNIKLS